VLNLEHISRIVEKHRAVAPARVKEFAIGGKPFAFKFTARRHGRCQSLRRLVVSRERQPDGQKARSSAEIVLAAQGADILTWGAESTLGHAARVDAAAQNSKLIPSSRDCARKKSRFRSKRIRLL